MCLARHLKPASPSGPPTTISPSAGTGSDRRSRARPYPTARRTLQSAASRCTAANACTAVGFFSRAGAGGDTAALVERWNGATWTIQSTPNPSGAASIGLSGVSCSSANACTAVGSFSRASSGGDYTALVERWNGATWTIQSTPHPKRREQQLSERRLVHLRQRLHRGREPGTGLRLGHGVGGSWDRSSWTIQSTPIPSGATSAI